MRPGEEGKRNEEGEEEVEERDKGTAETPESHKRREDTVSSLLRV